MTAREELYATLMKGKYHSPDNSEQASYLIDNLLHEEAEKVRKFAVEEYSHPKLAVCRDALERGVGLIDPYHNPCAEVTTRKQPREK